MIRKISSLALLCACFLYSERDSLAEELLDTEFGVKKVASGCKFTEGPAVAPNGDLYFSDIPNNRIMRLTPSGDLSEFRKPSHRTNGLMFDAQGRLVFCQVNGEGGGRAVKRIEKDGTETVLADTYQGKRLISPNDLAIDRQGRIYFTDPYYGQGDKSQPVSGVYRIDAPGKVTRIVEDLSKPNGILVTPDATTLYVADRGSNILQSYRLSPAGEATHAGPVYKFAPQRGIDGMWLDSRGNIYGAAGRGKTAGLYILSPAGKLLQFQRLPEFVTNVTFGGNDMRDIFVTGSTGVYKLRAKIPGATLPPNRPERKSEPNGS